MGVDYQTTFSLIEWLALTGFAQSLLILVYIVLRARQWRQAAIAIAYFSFLALAFGLQFALRLEDFAFPLRFWLGFCRAMGAPLCYLLVLQVSLVRQSPWRGLGVLLVVPAAFAAALVFGHFENACEGGGLSCPRFFQILSWFGGMSGALALLAIYFHKNIFRLLWTAKGGRERYWLVITLIVANILRIIVSLMLSLGYIERGDSDALQVTLGIAFAYLATTTLFRIYPLPVQLNASSRMEALLLTEDERAIADKILKLMQLDKIYHEASFSRADLAREVGASENIVSRVINQAFGKSFPKLLNEYRVEDAKRMLRDPAIPINILAFEVGFNSIASFNRVFREVAGETPSQFRQREKQETA
ncbi:MAG: AraC family transcriptional regulator [Micavibrio sp.]|nr:AraC family transcriptional regulator [Micavibrio sp.]